MGNSGFLHCGAGKRYLASTNPATGGLVRDNGALRSPLTYVQDMAAV